MQSRYVKPHTLIVFYEFFQRFAACFGLEKSMASRTDVNEAYAVGGAAAAAAFAGERGRMIALKLCIRDRYILCIYRQNAIVKGAADGTVYQ